MKGISHFITGVTAASFFPWSVEAAAQGNPIYFVLGAGFGLLPDTLDFKFYRFFYKHDLYIDPDPENPDPQAIADALADAVGKAKERDGEFRIKLNTIRIGADYWQQYKVKFDDEAQEVTVEFGPVVNTGQVPVPKFDKSSQGIGRAKFPCPLKQTYESVTTVDIFDGPSFALDPNKEGEVEISFLPWHRTWSHSLLTGAFFALLVTLLMSWHAGIIVFLAFAAHVMEDQLGHMGSNLFWPITKKRFSGLKRMHATDALPNFTTVWACGLVIFWNLFKQIQDPLWNLGFLHIMFIGGLVPLVSFALIQMFISRNKAPEADEIDMSKEEADPMMS